MSSQPIKDIKPIVKISWIVHNREYKVPIQTLLKEMGVELTDDEILVAVRKILSKI